VYIIEAKSVDDAYRQGMKLLEMIGNTRESRNGPVLEIPAPVVTQNSYPRRRVLTEHSRDANPFFHLFEAMWMLAGRRDVAWIAQYNKRMSSYSDDGEVFHGAYGHRWRSHFGKDQIEIVTRRLRTDPTDRRVVIQMWDPEADLDVASLDVPCNTTIYPRVVQTEGGSFLQMTVCCRSNDAIWGCHGSNAVHFSILQEYLASSIGVGVGRLYQLSNNYHAYHSVYGPLSSKPMIFSELRGDPRPLVDIPATFMYELRQWMEDPSDAFLYGNGFIGDVLVPMSNSWDAWKEKRLDQAMGYALRIGCPHWEVACCEWLARRAAK
jgi:hypothetical protein